MSIAARPGQLILRRTLDARRAELAQAVRDRIAGPEFQAIHERIWYTPGRAGSASRTRSGGSTPTPRCSSAALAPPCCCSRCTGSPCWGWAGRRAPDCAAVAWGRLQRTSRFLATTTYGTIADAERSIAIVRAIHRRVRGTTSTGRDCRADDPHLLGWIHAAQVDSFLTAYRLFGAEPLDGQRCPTAMFAESGLRRRQAGGRGTPADVRRELPDEVLTAYQP